MNAFSNLGTRFGTRFGTVSKGVSKWILGHGTTPFRGVPLSQNLKDTQAQTAHHADFISIASAPPPRT